LRAPRGYGWLTNPKKAAYNRVYNRTTFSVWRMGRTPLVLILLVIFYAVSRLG
jgi:hypothetical protein